MFKVEQYFIFKEGFDQLFLPLNLFLMMIQAERLSLGSMQSNNQKHNLILLLFAISWRTHANPLPTVYLQSS